MAAPMTHLNNVSAVVGMIEVHKIISQKGRSIFVIDKNFRNID
jgi:hypothetical protein